MFVINNLQTIRSYLVFEEPKLWQEHRVTFLCYAGGMVFAVALVVLKELIAVCFEKLLFRLENYEVLEKKVEWKFSFPIIDKVKAFNKFNYYLLLRRLAHCTDYEISFLNCIQDFHLSSSQWQSIFLGERVLLEDNGEMYLKWQEMFKNRAKLIPVGDLFYFRIYGSQFRALLFGLEEQNKKHYTFFQMESYPASVDQVIQTKWDYLQWKLALPFRKEPVKI